MAKVHYWFLPFGGSKDSIVWNCANSRNCFGPFVKKNLNKAFFYSSDCILCLCYYYCDSFPYLSSPIANKTY